MAGAPRRESSLVSDIRLRTGTMWHNHFNDLLIAAGKTVMHEVKVAPWLPQGWSGTADWLIWDEKARAFQLGDLKTTKGEGLQYIQRDGIKDEHMWQLSAYWHALREGNFPMLKKFFVLYLPMNDTTDDNEIEPVVVEGVPLSKDKVWGEMERRWALTEAYIDGLNNDYENAQGAVSFLTPELAPPMERVQKLFKNKDKWELKMVPHWSTYFCPFDDSLCDCNTQGTTKIGEWVEGNYNPRKGYEEIAPEYAPRN